MAITMSITHHNPSGFFCVASSVPNGFEYAIFAHHGNEFTKTFGTYEKRAGPMSKAQGMKQRQIMKHEIQFGKRSSVCMNGES